MSYRRVSQIVGPVTHHPSGVISGVPASEVTSDPSASEAVSDSAPPEAASDSPGARLPAPDSPPVVEVASGEASVTAAAVVIEALTVVLSG